MGDSSNDSGPTRSFLDASTTETRPTLGSITAILTRFWWQFTIVAVLVMASIITISQLRQPNEPQYQTEALVVATELEIRIDSFPRTAVAIFNGGTVANLAAQRAGTGIDPRDLIPHIVMIEPVENTSVVEIDAIHPDPELAALYANAAGQALVDELNRIGPGLGTFALQVRAPVPLEPLSQSILPTILFSAVAAVLFVTGLAALATMTRPSLRPSLADATVVANEPTLTKRIEQAASSDRRPVAAPASQWAAPEMPPVEEPVDNTPVPKPQLAPPADLTAGSSTESAFDKESPATSVAEPEVPARPAKTSPPRTSRERSRKTPENLEPELEELDPIAPFVQHLDKIPRPAPVHPLIASHEDAIVILRTITGVGPVFAARMAAAGVDSLEDLANADAKWLTEVVEAKPNLVQDWIDQAQAAIEPPAES